MKTTYIWLLSSGPITIDLTPDELQEYADAWVESETSNATSDIT